MFLKKRDGFSMIEMLTVIAIIGILAAMIFPIVSSAKKKAKQTQCINNMYQIFTAVKQFQLDERRYPDFIAGPAMPGVSLDNSTGMIGDETVALYPEYIKSTSGLRCPLSIVNGDGIEYTMTSTVADPLHTYWADLGAPAVIKSKRAEAVNPYALYAYSSYDYQRPRDHSAGPEAHYAPLWYYVADTATLPPPPIDIYERQLWWRTPPETTVITWCSYHRDSNLNGSKDLVLWLDGHVKPVPSTSLTDWTTVWMSASP